MTQIAHDSFFKSAMSDLSIAKGFLQQHLPSELQAKCEWSTLRLSNNEFVNERLQANIVDILLEAKIDGKDGYFYLLVEHQSTVDHFMAFRIIQSEVNIIAHHLDNTNSIPQLYSLVFYNGTRPYTAPLSFDELIANALPEVKAQLLRSYKLVNAHHLPDELLLQAEVAGLVQVVMKHIRNTAHLINIYHKLSPIIQTLGHDSNTSKFIMNMLNYVIERGQECNFDRLLDSIIRDVGSEGGEVVMTIREQMIDRGRTEGRAEGWQQGLEKGREEGWSRGRVEGREEGWSKGRVEGREEGWEEGRADGIRLIAVNMLKKGIDPHLISQAAGLTVDEVMKLREEEEMSVH